MAARKVSTPGAPEKAPTTAEQADAALEHITGQTSETPVTSDALVPVEQLDAVAQKLAEAEEKIKALEAQSKAQSKTAAPAQPINSRAPEVKRLQNVLTDRGWDSVEE